MKLCSNRRLKNGIYLSVQTCIIEVIQTLFGDAETLLAFGGSRCYNPFFLNELLEVDHRN